MHEEPAIGRGERSGHPTVSLAAGELEATFVPGAGMLGLSLLHRGEELLGQRYGLDAYVAEGRTMGLPFLAPWANRLSRERFAAGGREVDLAAAGPLARRDGNGLPIHGLLGAAPGWRVEALGVEGPAAVLRARFDSADADPRLALAFPFPFAFEHAIALDPAGLRVETTLTATGDAPVPVAFGFHPYLTLPGADRAAWRLALPARRLVETGEGGLPTGERRALEAEASALGDRELDEGFDDLPAGAELSLEGGGRRLTVRLLDGYPAAQVFAPPGQPLVALEPMTAPTDALVSGDGLRLAAPGSPFIAAFRIDAETT